MGQKTFYTIQNKDIILIMLSTADYQNVKAKLDKYLMKSDIETSSNEAGVIAKKRKRVANSR